MRYMDKELDLLQLDLIKMSACVKESLDLLQKLFDGENAQNADETLSLFHEVKRYQTDVESQCVRLLLLRQPVAGDLRRIKSALSVIVDLSRIAEQSCHVAERTLAFHGYSRPARMLEQVREMVQNACDSYLNADARLAESTVAADDALDETFAAVKKDLVEMLKRGGIDDWVLDCLLAVKYMERMGDHAVRIAGAARALL